MSRIDVTVVPHTHWDREWYHPFQVFRYHLVALIDRVLDLLAADPDFGPFTLDGQTIVLEDYLALRPHREAELRQHVQAGRLLIGPWHVLPDEFLVGGEAIVRNLMLGRKICQRFGGWMAVGYVPDPFGHIGQLPQILAQCGIDAAVFRRGLSDEPTELWWEAPDGTRLLTVYLRDGYDNAAHLPGDLCDFISTIRAQVASLAPHGATPHVLLMNGGDHMSPRSDLSALIGAANERLEDVRLRQGSLPQFIATIRHDLGGIPIVCGELRSSKRHYLLPGVLSARMWIKQQNDAVETELVRYAEPLAAISRFLGGRDQCGELWQAWRYLIENHAHDSICGCSVDQVHEEMRTRFAWSAQLAGAVAGEGLLTLARHVSGPRRLRDEPLPETVLDLYPERPGRVVTVFNPAGGPRTDRVVFQLPELPPSQTYRLLAEDGRPIPLTLSAGKARLLAGWTLDAAGLADLLEQMRHGGLLSRAMGDASLRLKEESLDPQKSSQVYAELDLTLLEMAEIGGADMTAVFRFVADLRRLLDEERIASWHVRVWLSGRASASFMARDVPGYGYRAYQLESVNGLKVEASGLQIEGFNFQSPTFNLQPSTLNPPTGPSIENEFFSVEADPLDGTLRVLDRRTGLRFEGLNQVVDNGDCGDTYNHCPPAGDWVIDRPAGPPRIAIYDEGPAGWRLEVARRYRLPVRLAGRRRRRSARVVSVPAVSRVWLRPGVPRVDIETTVDNRAEDHRLRVVFPTPFRTDQALAGGQFDVVARPLALPADTAGYVERPVPTAPHCGFIVVQQGEHGLLVANQGLPEYEVVPGDGGVAIVLTLLRSVGWLSRDDLECRPGHAGPGLPTPGAQCPGVHTFAYSLIPFAGQLSTAIHLAHAFRAPLRAVVAGSGDGRLPACLSFVNLEPAELVISVIKPADDGDGWIVRFWNASDRPVTARLTAGFDLAQAEQVNLLEEPLNLLSPHDRHEVQVPVRGKQIVSVRLRPA